ncbi:exonuclease [Streptomyces phage Annadreamy]|uniref:Exonuclease n=2 Tax=Annadreamyvirus annadreamy TaxID=2846392 RepID=A0A345GTC6_9CAUD|nr:DNA polymerase exonuclease subunit [Streptomyces phage Annadreamy]AXG66198.1 exonuclease [Streptomyces phage Annadreamy]QGH79411.1 exonuclease [Streptomyces phage Limpid]
MKKFVFVDTETTGLDSTKDKLVEVTYAVENDEPLTLFFGVKKVPAFIDDLTKFSARRVYDEPAATEEQLDEFRETLRNQTMVAANPKFDVGFLEANGLYTAHYRTLDVQSYAMAKLNLSFLPSMNEIHFALRARGFSFTEPDHSSRNDVLFMREAFNVLRYQI